MGHCDGLTPPKCDLPHANRTRREILDRNDWELHQQLTVLDPPDSEESNQDLETLLNAQLSTNNPLSEFCVSIAAFGLLVASSTFLFTVTAGVGIALMVVRRQSSIENLLFHK
jgi:hypothetical protein